MALEGLEITLSPSEKPQFSPVTELLMVRVPQDPEVSKALGAVNPPSSTCWRSLVLTTLWGFPLLTLCSGP